MATSPSPLRALSCIDVNNRTFEPPLTVATPSQNPLAFLASIALPSPLCTSKEPGFSRESSDLFECKEEIFASARPRCPSRDGAHSRASSVGELVPGRMYVCKQCQREYASTDAVRKHARMVHPEWIKAQGQGCPSLYCMAVDDAPSARESASPAGPAAEELSSMFSVAHSFVALSKAAAFAHSTPSQRAPSNDHARSSAWDASSRKRPRTVRCGKCEACVCDDCGSCKNCVDKPKFGGLGQRKQGCIKKVCRSRVPAE